MNNEIAMMHYLLNKTCNVKSSDFEICSFDDLHNGDIIMSTTMTNSQKYICKTGCEEYNMTKYGILFQKNIDDPENSILFRYDKDENTFMFTNLYRNPGSSGSFLLRRIKN